MTTEVSYQPEDYVQAQTPALVHVNNILLAPVTSDQPGTVSVSPYSAGSLNEAYVGEFDFACL